MIAGIILAAVAVAAIAWMHVTTRRAVRAVDKAVAELRAASQPTPVIPWAARTLTPEEEQKLCDDFDFYYPRKDVGHG